LQIANIRPQHIKRSNFLQIEFSKNTGG